MHLEMFRVLHQMDGYLDKNDYHCLMKFILRYMVMSICRESIVNVQESILRNPSDFRVVKSDCMV